MRHKNYDKILNRFGTHDTRQQILYDGTIKAVQHKKGQAQIRQKNTKRVFLECFVEDAGQVTKNQKTCILTVFCRKLTLKLTI